MSSKIKSVRIKFDKILYDTGKAYLIRIGYSEYWLPRYACRNLIVNKKLGGNVCIPVSLADEKGITWSDEMADVIITHHIPKPLKPDNLKPDASLTR